MTMTDPIADLLTRIRNANRRGLVKVDIPSSGLKQEIARVLHEEHYIDNYTVIKDHRQGILRVYLRYGPGKTRIIRGLKRISRPGRRVYTRKDKISRPMGGMGIAIISTSKGVFTDAQARKAETGGEVICYVW